MAMTGSCQVDNLAHIVYRSSKASFNVTPTSSSWHLSSLSDTAAYQVFTISHFSTCPFTVCQSPSHCFRSKFQLPRLGFSCCWRRDCLCQRFDFDRMASNQSQRSEFDDISELGGVFNSSLVRQQQSLLLAVNLLFLYAEDTEPAGYCHTNPII